MPLNYRKDNLGNLIRGIQLVDNTKYCFFLIPVCGNISKKVTVVQDSSGSAHG